MITNDEKYRFYLETLNTELIVAMGCTEPIALSLAAANLAYQLGHMPDHVEAYICGNIIKNAKSVTVPNTNGLKGIKSALVAGLVVAKPELKLEILEALNEKKLNIVNTYLQEDHVKVILANKCKSLYIKLVGIYKNDIVTVIVEDYHDNIVYLSKNGKVLLEHVSNAEMIKEKANNLLNVKDIVDFANSVKIEDIDSIINRQIKYNMRIARMGIKGNFGAQIGKIILKGCHKNDIFTKAIAFAAAGSDARMAGCDLPVVIVSGSGNQGITSSVPVIVYAHKIKATHEKLLRALVISNLVTILEKKDIGRLSAFCGAVSAGSGAICGIAYLDNGSYDAIAHTIVNSLAITSGMVCDGAKSSCAAKIAAALNAGVIGYKMYLAGTQFKQGEGLVNKCVDSTIHNIGRLASIGMEETDQEILKIMTGEEDER